MATPKLDIKLKENFDHEITYTMFVPRVLVDGREVKTVTRQR
jgi:hypothetical protein